EGLSFFSFQGDAFGRFVRRGHFTSERPELGRGFSFGRLISGFIRRRKAYARAERHRNDQSSENQFFHSVSLLVLDFLIWLVSWNEPILGNRKSSHRKALFWVLQLQCSLKVSVGSAGIHAFDS